MSKISEKADHILNKLAGVADFVPVAEARKKLQAEKVASRGEGMGVGGVRQGDGGAAVCR